MTRAAADPSKLVRSALLRRGRIASFDELRIDTGLSRTGLRPAIAPVVRSGAAFVVLRHLVSVDPPAPIDEPPTPLWLRTLAAVAAHGSLNAAVAAGTLPAGNGTFRVAGKLYRADLLAAADGDLFVPELPETEGLRRLALRRR